MWLRSIEKLAGKCYNDSHVARMLLYNGIVQSKNTWRQIISKKTPKMQAVSGAEIATCL